MYINKDTKVYISLAKNAGNFGCAIHNAAFKYHKLNCIYKSLSITDLEFAVKGMRALGILGAGVTMPYKIQVLKYLDLISDEVNETGSCNTLVNNNGIIKGYNTDIYSTTAILNRYKDEYKQVVILGEGGFSKAAQFSAKNLNLEVKIINRKNWNELDLIKDGLIFNCTPVPNLFANHPKVAYIDCLIDTKTGQDLSLLQASKQFELYTGLDFPFSYIHSQLSLLISKTSFF